MNVDVETIHPQQDHLLVRLDRGGDMTKGGLYIPSQAVKDYAWGKVLKIGPDVHEVAVGQTVLCDENRGTNLGRTEGGQLLNFYRPDELIAIIEEEDEK